MSKLARILTIAALFIAAGAALSYALLFNSFPRELQLVARYPNSDNVLCRIPVEPGDSFTLAYRHSVSNSMVHGEFELTGKGLILPETTTYTSFGPGLPWPGDKENIEIDKGLFTVTHDEPPREKLQLWTSNLTGEKLIFSGREYNLAPRSGEPVLVEIYLEFSRSRNGKRMLTNKKPGE